MAFSGRICYLTAFLTGFSAFVGDFLESKQKVHWAVAVADNATHFIVGVLTWLSVSAAHGASRSEQLYECLLCGIIASLVDLDHFVTAGSWRLMDATSLKNRPFLHCTSLILVLASTLILVGRHLSIHCVWNLGWIVAAAGISHHVRDATRRGFWLWPVTSTLPLPYYLYLIILILLPIGIPFLQNLVPVSVSRAAQDFLIV